MESQSTTKPEDDRPQGSGRRRRWPTRLRLIGITGLLLPWAAVGVLLWWRRPYYLDLASQGSLHGAAAMAFLALALLGFKRWLGAASCGFASLAIAMLWSTWARPPAAAPPTLPPGGVQFRIAHYNAFAHASRHDEQFAQWLQSQDTEIVVIVDSPWRYVDAQPWLAERYPYRVEPDASFQWPMTVLSKYPTTPASEIFAFPSKYPGVEYSFTAQRAPVVTLPDGQRFLISAMHPPSPRTVKSWTSSLRIARREAEMIHAWREGTGLGVLVTGDFNSTPAGRVHRTFARLSGLTGWSALSGGGTWPADYSPWISIPIDRIWTSDGMVVRSVDIGPQFKSDHRPFVAEVYVPPLRTRAQDDDR